MSYDFLGALASFLSTYYFINQDKKAWLMGLLATFINGWLYWQKGIYADMCLESFYAMSTVYGWYHWSQTKSLASQQPQCVKPSSLQILSLTAILIFIIFLPVYFILHHYLRSSIATLDAITCAMSLVAQGLMCRQIIHTWIVWFIADSLYAVIYFQKCLPYHGLLMITYMIMAVAGYKNWLRLKTQASLQPKQAG